MQPEFVFLSRGSLGFSSIICTHAREEIAYINPLYPNDDYSCHGQLRANSGCILRGGVVYSYYVPQEVE